jgi:hypothetical protein
MIVVSASAGQGPGDLPAVKETPLARPTRPKEAPHETVPGSPRWPSSPAFTEATPH